MDTEHKATAERPRSGLNSDVANYFLHKDENTYGPETKANLRALYEDGWLLPDDLIWREGDPEWLRALEVFGSSFVEAPVVSADEAPIPLAARDALILSLYPAEGAPWPWGSFSIAVIVHVALALTLLLWLHLYPIRFTAYTPVPPSLDPPLEVTMEPEAPPTPPPPPPPDPTPPDPTPPDPPPLPPPPVADTEPPPPPAPAVMPLPVPPPPAPAPIVPELPSQATPAPAPVAAVPRHHEAPKVAHRVPAALAPPEPQPAATDNDEPQYLSNPRPVYPFTARQRHQEGTVILRVVLDGAGNPVSVSVEQSSGYTILDDAALKKVAADWRFKPGQGSTVHVPVEFQLEQ